MPSAQITISLDGGQPRGPLREYRPGETVRGHVLVVPEDSFECRHLYIQLRWHTEGRGDRDERVVAQHDVYAGSLAPRLPLSFDYAFTLPAEPWSYAGHYVNIVWEIAVSLDVPRAADPRASQAFVMAPDRPS